MDARDNTKKTPLHYAAQWGQEEALDFLIECGADVNATDFIEDTPLHFVRNFSIWLLAKAQTHVRLYSCTVVYCYSVY